MTAAKRIAIAVVEHPKSGRFLVGVRPEGVPLAGCDEFPGGKVDADESFEAAAIRECAEETGLRVSIVGEYPSAEHNYAHGSLQLRFFRCVVLEDDAETEPHGPFRWLTRAELAECNFPEANSELLGLLTG